MISKQLRHELTRSFHIDAWKNGKKVTIKFPEQLSLYPQYRYKWQRYLDQLSDNSVEGNYI